VERIQVKNAPQQSNDVNAFGASRPANGEGVNPATAPLGDPVFLHAQPYGRLVDEAGNADCETGQRGYVERLADGAPSEYKIAVDPRTPGNQGTTFSGRTKVPDGQTFTSEPETGFKPGG